MELCSIFKICLEYTLNLKSEKNKELRRITSNNYIPIFIGVILRLINIQNPIVGVHSWRQADTAAMARHFAINNTPIWLPQIDWAGASEGYVESEFPIFPYILGQLYKLLGINEWIGRGLSILFSAITIALIIRIGTKLFDQKSGWWAGIFFSILPIGIYYGRTLQAEAFLLLLATISLDRMIAWKEKESILDLTIAWISFCLACLIKVIPILWLGIPLLIINLQYTSSEGDISKKSLLQKIITSYNSKGQWMFLSTAILISIIWYGHAYKLGLSSGLSFGFWGESSDRSNLNIMLNPVVWGNLFLRLSVRNLAILGFPLFIYSTWKNRNNIGGQILISGLVGLFISTIIALNASSIHEYYQLPLQIFACLLMGKTWADQLKNFKHINVPSKLMPTILILITAISLIILSLDYWRLEQRQAKVWMPLAIQIRSIVPPEGRIVTTTGSDPTLLNLARRQGWLLSSGGINKAKLRKLYEEGASHIAGSLSWEESHILLKNETSKKELKEFICESAEEKYCPAAQEDTFIIPISELIK